MPYSIVKTCIRKAYLRIFVLCASRYTLSTQLKGITHNSTLLSGCDCVFEINLNVTNRFLLPTKYWKTIVLLVVGKKGKIEHKRAFEILCTFAWRTYSTRCKCKASKKAEKRKQNTIAVFCTILLHLYIKLLWKAFCKNDSIVCRIPNVYVLLVVAYSLSGEKRISSECLLPSIQSYMCYTPTECYTGSCVFGKRIWRLAVVTIYKHQPSSSSS